MRAVVEGFASHDLLCSFIPNRIAVQLALNAKFEIFDMCDEVYSFLELI